MASRPPRYVPWLPLPERPWRLGSGMPRAALPDPLVQPASRLPARTWREPTDLGPDAQEVFRYGVDLFNHSAWWEAHEVWEALWARSVRGSSLFHLLQGLILLAAARLHAVGPRPAGSQALARRAAAHLRATQAAIAVPSPLGLSLQRTLEALAPAQAILTETARPTTSSLTLWLDAPATPAAGRH